MGYCEGCGEEFEGKQRGRPRKWCGRGRCAKPKLNERKLAAVVPAGTRFERLTVLEYRGANDVAVRCDCGVEKVASSWDLKNGAVKSCGCLRAEKVRERQLIHGGAGTPEHRVWAAIKQRIFNPAHPAFRHYGGRGLTMEPEWVDDFPAFLAEVGPKPSPELSIDRVDNDLGYVKGNLRWATAAQQTANRRVMRDAA